MNTKLPVIVRQQKCCFCNTKLSESDYQNKNDFYLACSVHKVLAQTETEKFFNENPQYEKWSNRK